MTTAMLDFDTLRELVFAESGLMITPEHREIAEARLSSLACRRGMTSVSELVSLLRSRADGRLHRSVIRTVTAGAPRIGYATPLGELMRSTIIPELAQRPGTKRSVRVWCANCAGGQSPYGMALLLREHLRPRTARQIHVLATDRSPSVIEQMRTGSFDEPDVNHEMSSILRDRYFQLRGAEWQINDDVRDLIEFRTLDLAAPWPVVGRFDLIMLGDTLPYYETATRRRILVRLHDLLSDDGYLLLGEDEMIDEADSAGGQWQEDAPGLYRLRGTPTAHASSRQIRTVIANATEEAD